MNKIRLDKLLVTKGLIESLEKARALILEGLVLVNDTKTDKAGTLVDSNSDLKILQTLPYVSRGGLKLEAALRDFNINITGKTAMDVGASTGGFTDCLLQHGAKEVYAVDVGYGQFAWKLRNDPRVTVFEKTNIRYFIRENIPAEIDIATIDVSFISLLKVIPKVMEFLCPAGEIIALIKPQFEALKKDVEKGGVIKNETKRAEIVDTIIREVEKMGLEVKGVIKSPLTGPKGNVEFLIYLKLKQ
ncbi:MAG: TlyA family RNA methyltransferase [Nitrospirota bacterium]